MIEIDDDFKILAQQYDFALVLDTHKVSKVGRPVYKYLGYYSDIQGCLRGLLKYKVRTAVAEEDYTLPSVIERIDEIIAEIKDLAVYKL